MNELEATVRLINKLVDWTDKACNLFYVTQEHKEISSDNLKSGFNKFIGENFSNAKFENIEDLKNKFTKLSYDEKISYFDSESIYVLDCTNINKDNIYTFNTIYDLTKDGKFNFIHYVDVKNHMDYLIHTQTYQMRTQGLENIDDILCKIHNYNEFKNEIESMSENKVQTKKVKM